jgi:hypothetical protein
LSIEANITEIEGAEEKELGGGVRKVDPDNYSLVLLDYDEIRIFDNLIDTSELQVEFQSNIGYVLVGATVFS